MKETKPLKPYIPIEQVYAFDPARPETFTCSPLVNAVLEAFHHPELRSGTAMGRYFQLDPRHISGALLIATGYGLNELRRLWTIHRAQHYLQQHPDCGPEEICHAVGYRDRTSLWQAINAPRINRKKREHEQWWRSMTPQQQHDYLIRALEAQRRAREQTREFLEELRKKES